MEGLEGVLEASVESYKRVGQRVRVREVSGDSGEGHGPQVLIDGLRRVEHIESEESFDDFDRDIAVRHAYHDTEVWYLVPLTRIGQAHDRLKGVADRIQPWWVAEGRVRLGTPREP